MRPDQRLALRAGIASERPTPKSRPSDRSRLLEHVVERPDEGVGLLLRGDERRQDLEHVLMVAGDLREDSVVAEQRDDHELREQTAPHRLEERPLRPERIDFGRRNSMPIIRPRPRTSWMSSCRSARPAIPDE